MIITCDKCSAKFNMDGSKIKLSGTKVRCSRCKNVFVAYPAEALKSPEPEKKRPLPAAKEHSDAHSALDNKAIQQPAVDNPDIELDLDNIDFSLGSDNSSNREVPDATDDLDFDHDMDFSLTGSDSVSSQSKTSDENFDLDLDMDFSLEYDEKKSRQQPAESIEISINMDSDIEPEAAAGKNLPEDFDSGLNLDFDLNDIKKEIPLAESELSSKELDFDLDLDLGLDQETPAAKPESGSEELDFDLDLDLGLDQEAPAAKPESGSEELGFDLDLDLGLDQKAPAAKPESGSEELDFDLDLDLGLDQEAPAAKSESGSEELDFDLDLDLGLDQEAPATKPESGSEELGFDLDLELEDTSAALSATDNKTKKNEEELDLDLDFAFEESPVDKSSKSGENVDEIELELDLGLDDTDSVRSEKITVVEENLSLDLDFTQTDISADKSEDIELEFDIQSEEVLMLEKDSDDIDFSLDLEIDEQPASHKKTLMKETDDFEFELDEDIAPKKQNISSKSGSGIDATIFAGDMEVTDDATIAMPDADTGTSEPSVRKIASSQPVFSHQPPKYKHKKKTGRKPVFALIVIALIGAGGYYAAANKNELSDFLKTGKNKLGMIPVIGKYLDGKADDAVEDSAGTLKINFVEYKEKFLQNSKEGNLFVIEGKIINNYNMPRSSISITGKLITSKKQVAQNKTVFAGNLIPDTELAKLGIIEIEKRLGNVSGVNGINIDIPSGKEIPFMIVFSKLPQDLENYSVEVTKSY